VKGIISGTCDYGCGQNATHIFKNGTKCCSKYPVKCPKIRERISRSVSEYYDKTNGGIKKKKTVTCQETDFFKKLN